MGAQIKMRTHCQKVPNNTTEQVGGRREIPGHTGLTRQSMHSTSESYRKILIEKYSWIIMILFLLLFAYGIQYFSIEYPDYLTQELVSKTHDCLLNNQDILKKNIEFHRQIIIGIKS